MQFTNFEQFFAMGGYGAYVWSSFGITALLLIWNSGIAKYREFRMRREVKQWQLQEKDDSR
ncbi:MAG: heme exporter protein CcmD [Gammaproteobacteria bacterium]|nr:heme exporter protein CcmD [Gammaproteobacteria bacterium]